MNVLKSLLGNFEPLANLVDSVHTSQEEKLELKTQLLQTQTASVANVLSYEETLAKQKASIVLAEAKSEGWLTRNWRPITMLSFVTAVMAHWFGLTPYTLSPQAVEAMFLLVQIGLGGYVVGRSAEKVVPSVVKALKKADNA